MKQDNRRRGTVMILVMVMLMTLLGFAALTIDVGAMYNTKADLQKVADGCSLAGAQVVVYENGDIHAVASRIAEGNPVFAHGPIKLAFGDVEAGRFSLETNTFIAGDDQPNAVRVVARREENSPNGPHEMFLAQIFGINSANIKAVAVAMVPLLKSVDNTTPIALRTPWFGSIDPAITEANPGKDGPSEPHDRVLFKIGEKVTVFVFGKGKKSPVHLMLNTNEINGEAQLGQVMRGDREGVRVLVGDVIDVLGDGTGHNGIGVKLASRLDDNDPGNDTIIMPVVRPILEPRDCNSPCEPTFSPNGKLDGDVMVVDFVAVHLDAVEPVTVPDPNRPGKFINIEILVGTVVRRSVGGGPTDETSGYVDGSVTGMPQLVK